MPQLITVFCVVLLMASPRWVAAAEATGATGGGATGITFAAGFQDEGQLTQSIIEAATTNCFLTTIRFNGIETCWRGIFPQICVRMRNNWLSNLLEASGKRQHFAVMTTTASAFLSEWGSKEFAAPTNKKIGHDDSSNQSASGRVMARTLGPPLVYEALGVIIQGATFYTLCKPEDLKFGYIYFAEGDETAVGTSMWRSIISPYYLNRMTSGVSLFAKATETAGLCGLDLNYMLCIGGFGTKYPTSGDIGAGSPALRLITGMWRAQEITAAPAGVYGPYDVALGLAVHAQLHLPTSIVGGVTARLPPYSPGSYMQWLYPGIGASAVGHSDVFCSILGVGPGSSPIAMNQMLSETINDTWIEEDTLAFAYWTRWTCCQWCRGTADEAARHMIPEKGFSPVLSRRP